MYTTPELERAHRKLGKVLEKRAGGELKQIRKRVQKLAGALGMEITVSCTMVLLLPLYAGAIRTVPQTYFSKPQ